MKNPHYHKRSRDLYPKPFSNHYTERFPWVEPDDPFTTKLILLAAVIGFTVSLGIIYVMSLIAKLFL